MLGVAVAALACLCLARCSSSELLGMRAYSFNPRNYKDLSTILMSIEERLRTVDTISATQVKQARRLEVLHDKLDRVETTLSLRLERAQLAAERLEHRLHILQTGVQASVKVSTEKLARSQHKITEIAQNFTNHIDSHKRLLEKVNGAYADTWHRGLVLESMMRDGLSLVNATRRELADGLQSLARRQRDSKFYNFDNNLTKRIQDSTNSIDVKIQELLNSHKEFVNTCQREQHDAPKHVTDVLDKLIDSLIDKMATTFRELQGIHTTLHSQDTKIMKLLNNGRPNQSDAACRRLENTFRNTSLGTFKEHELQQLTEKFVALTNRADVALQHLESRISMDGSDNDVSAAADELMLKLNGIKEDIDFDSEDVDEPYGTLSDIMDADKEILSKARKGRQVENVPTRPPHRRHLHKHPYDRGPIRKKHPKSKLNP